jgi:hypothetical protein
MLTGVLVVRTKERTPDAWLKLAACDQLAGGKFQPSNMNRKWRMAEKADKSSRSNVECFNSGEDNFLLKNASSNHVSSVNCCKTPPTWVSEASTAREMTAPGVGCTRLEQDANPTLPVTKAALADSDQTNIFRFPPSKSVNGCKVPAIPGRNLR